MRGVDAPIAHHDAQAADERRIDDFASPRIFFHRCARGARSASRIRRDRARAPSERQRLRSARRPLQIEILGDDRGEQLLRAVCERAAAACAARSGGACLRRPRASTRSLSGLGDHRSDEEIAVVPVLRRSPRRSPPDRRRRGRRPVARAASDETAVAYRRASVWLTIAARSSEPTKRVDQARVERGLDAPRRIVARDPQRACRAARRAAAARAAARARASSLPASCSARSPASVASSSADWRSCSACSVARCTMSSASWSRALDLRAQRLERRLDLVAVALGFGDLLVAALLRAP